MENTNEARRAQLVMMAARNAWERMGSLRESRRRYRRFTYGDQWSDTITLPSGERVTEREAAAKSGREPFTNNLIRRMVKTIVGRFRMERLEQSLDLREADPDGHNRLDELDARTLEEFLISGMAIHRVCRERRPDGSGAWADNISPDRFFINDIRDCRGGDTELAGCLHDMSLGELVMRFSFGSARRADQLKKLYGAMAVDEPVLSTTSCGGDVDSFLSAPTGRCRVIEVWTLESRERMRCHDPLTASITFLPIGEASRIKRENSRRRRAGQPLLDARWEVATVWHCRCLAPDATVLDSFDSPLPDGSLPFSIKLYPLVAGEVHSLVEDVIDQQKYVNRLISLLDHIMNVSAKGVLLFPDKCFPGMEKDRAAMRRRVAEAWAQPGSMIEYRPYENHLPQQVATNATDIGAREMLQTQIQLFEDISGVNASLMGKTISAAVGAERYESELRNSAISILDLMQTFADFTRRRNALLRAI